MPAAITNTRGHRPHTPIPDPRSAHEHPHSVRSVGDRRSVECRRGSVRRNGGGWQFDMNRRYTEIDGYRSLFHRKGRKVRKDIVTLTLRPLW